MAALELRDGVALDPSAFAAFIDEGADLPPRWRPSFVRVARALASTATNKVLKRALRREKFLVDRIDDPVYWRPRGEKSFRRFTVEDLRALSERFAAAGYADRLES